MLTIMDIFFITEWLLICFAAFRLIYGLYSVGVYVRTKARIWFGLKLLANGFIAPFLVSLLN